MIEQYVSAQEFENMTSRTDLVHELTIVHYKDGEPHSVPYKERFDDFLMADEMFTGMTATISGELEKEHPDSDVTIEPFGGVDNAIMITILVDDVAQFDVCFEPNVKA